MTVQVLLIEGGCRFCRGVVFSSSVRRPLALGGVVATVSENVIRLNEVLCLVWEGLRRGRSYAILEGHSYVHGVVKRDKRRQMRYAV